MGKRKYAITVGILAGGMVFLLGFFVMFWLWKIIGTYSALPGLFDYRAATIGDSVCLPIMTGSLVMFLLANNNLKKTQMVFVRTIFILALLGGICIQMKWLLDDETKLNWSIPILHYFNAAGWYHSLFFIGMCGVTAGLLLATFLTLKNKTGNIGLYDSISVSTAIGAGNLFLLLHIADDYADIDNRYSFMVTTLIIFSITVLMTWKTIRNTTKKIGGYLLGGLGFSYFAALLICGNLGNRSILAGVAVATAACSLWQAEKENIRELIIKDIMTIFITYGAFSMALSGGNKWKILIADLIIIAIAVLVEKIVNGEVRFHFVPVALIIIYTGLTLFLVNIRGGSEVAILIFSIALSMTMEMKIKHSFQYVIQTEERVNRGEVNNLAEAKAKEYLQLGICAVALVSIVIYWAKHIVTNYSFTVEKGCMISNFYLCVGIGVCCIVLYVIGCSYLKRKKASIVIAIIILFCIHAGILINYCMNVQGIPIIRADFSTAIVMVLGFFAAIGTPLMLADGFYRNLAGLYYAEKKPLVMVFALLNGIFCLVHNFFIIFGQLTFSSWENIFLAICNISIIYILLPVLCARIIGDDLPRYHVITASSLGGIRQDGFLIALIVIVVICIPSSFIGVLHFENAWQFLGIISVLTPVFIPLVFCLENNVGNVRRQKKY